LLRDLGSTHIAIAVGTTVPKLELSDTKEEYAGPWNARSENA
jgi:hypothetical protein